MALFANHCTYLNSFYLTGQLKSSQLTDDVVLLRLHAERQDRVHLRSIGTNADQASPDDDVIGRVTFLGVGVARRDAERVDNFALSLVR